MKKPTKAEIEAEIKTLTEMKPNVRHYSMFNDDHHASIEAQITVLRDDLDEDGIYELFEDEESSTDLAVIAMEARAWLDGKAESAPHVDWQSLLIKK